MSEPWWRNWGARYFEEDLNTGAEQNKQDRDSPRCSRCRTSTCGNKCWREPRASVNWKLLTMLAVDRSRKEVTAEAGQADVLQPDDAKHDIYVVVGRGGVKRQGERHVTCPTCHTEWRLLTASDRSWMIERDHDTSAKRPYCLFCSRGLEAEVQDFQPRECECTQQCQAHVTSRRSGCTIQCPAVCCGPSGHEGEHRCQSCWQAAHGRPGLSAVYAAQCFRRK